MEGVQNQRTQTLQTGDKQSLTSYYTQDGIEKVPTRRSKVATVTFTIQIANKNSVKNTAVSFHNQGCLNTTRGNTCTGELFKSRL